MRGLLPFYSVDEMFDVFNDYGFKVLIIHRSSDTKQGAISRAQQAGAVRTRRVI